VLPLFLDLKFDSALATTEAPKFKSNCMLPTCQFSVAICKAVMPPSTKSHEKKMIN